MSQLHEHAAYSQMLDQQLIDEAAKMVNDSNNGTSQLSHAFEDELAKMSTDAKQGGQELFTLVPHVFTLLNNPKTTMYQKLRDYIARRSPSGVASKQFTLGEAEDFIANADFSEFEDSTASTRGSSFATLLGDDVATEEINSTGSKWLQRLSAVGKKAGGALVKGFKLLFRVALHAGALFLLYSVFSGDKSDAPSTR